MTRACPILVVALHALRPNSDALSEMRSEAARYRDLLASLGSPRIGAPLVDWPQLRLYAPIDARICDPMGLYNAASLYLADDLESVIRLASRVTATVDAGTFLFGPVVGKNLDGLEGLLDTEPKGGRCLAIIRFKLADPLVAVGGEQLVGAVARCAEVLGADGIEAACVRSFAWHEIALVLHGPDPEALARVCSALGALRLSDALDAHPPLAAQLGAPIARQLLARFGPPGAPTDIPLFVAHSMGLGLRDGGAPGLWARIETASKSLPTRPPPQVTPERSAAPLEWSRRSLNRRSLGKVERHALQQLSGAVSGALGRSDMLAAAIPLDAVLRSLHSELLGTPPRDPGDLTFVVREVIREAQTAWRQQTGHAALVGGTPAVNVEVPRGAGGLTGMLGAVTEAILNLGHAATEGRGGPYETLVVLGADASVAMRSIRRIGIFHMSYLQAFAPMGLGVLYHELGHWLVRRIFAGRYAVWRGETAALARVLTSRDTLGDPRQRAVTAVRRHGLLTPFVEDIAAHASWRLLGCGGDLARFEADFLTSMAMGLRLGSDLGDPVRALESWATALAHLAIQRALAASGDVLDDAFDALIDALLDGESLPWGDLVLETASYHGPELARLLPGRDVSDALHQMLVRLWFEPVCMLAEYSNHTAPIHRKLALILTRFSQLGDDLNLLEAQWSEASPAFAHLDARISRGLGACEAPWRLLGDDGRPGLRAFVWIRRILGAASASFAESARHGPVALRRGGDGEIMPGTEGGEGLEGGYADHFGGVFVAGREARMHHLNVTVSAIGSLMSVSSRVMAGRLARFAACQRRASRMAIDREARVIWLDEDALAARCPEARGIERAARWRLHLRPSDVDAAARRYGVARAVDISPEGLGLLDGPGRAPTGAVLLCSVDGRSLLGRVRWRRPWSGKRARVGVQLIAEVSWTPGTPRLEGVPDSIAPPITDWLWRSL